MRRLRRLPLSRILPILILTVSGLLVALLPRRLTPARQARPATAVVLADSGRIPADSLPLDSVRVATALATVSDPEIAVSIADLGLIESLTVRNHDITVTLLTTSPRCPHSRRLASDVLTALLGLPGAGRITVRLDTTRRWNSGRLTPKLRQHWQQPCAGSAPSF